MSSKTKRPLVTADMVFNQLMAKNSMSLMSRANAVFGDGEQEWLDKECKYLTNDPDASVYKRLYERNGIAQRVVNVYPQECWASYPRIYEREDDRVTTAFEREVNRLERRLNPLSYLARLDEAAGIGHYGAMLLGLDDNVDLSQPVSGMNEYGEKDGSYPKKLNFLRIFDETLIQIAEYETSLSNPRFGQPKSYNLKLVDPQASALSIVATPNSLQSVGVHWSRVIHFADNVTTSEIIGAPRMKPVLNYLFDIRKILGGSAEMFWKGGFPGYAFEAFPQLSMEGEVDLDEATVRQQFQEYFRGLKRYLAVVGGTIKSLAPQVADPSNHLTQQLTFVSATIGVPLRILCGSETGHLASTQDRGNLNSRLMRRNKLNLEPRLVRPFYDRLQLIDVLPVVDDYIADWSDLNAMTDADKADVGMKLTQALLQYVTSGAFKLIAPKEYFVHVLKFSEEQADAFITSMGGTDKMNAALDELITMTTGNQNDSSAASGNPTKKTGTAGKRNSLG